MYKYYYKMNTSKITKKKKNKLHGGTRIGSGSYGCVVTPALLCDNVRHGKNISKTNLTKKNNNNNKNKTISKIVLNNDTESINSEINSNNKLRKFDPNMHYFLTNADFKCTDFINIFQ